MPRPADASSHKFAQSEKLRYFRTAGLVPQPRLLLHPSFPKLREKAHIHTVGMWDRDVVSFPAGPLLPWIATNNYIQDSCGPDLDSDLTEAPFFALPQLPLICLQKTERAPLRSKYRRKEDRVLLPAD